MTEIILMIFIDISLRCNMLNIQIFSSIFSNEKLRLQVTNIGDMYKQEPFEFAPKRTVRDLNYNVASEILPPSAPLCFFL